MRISDWISDVCSSDLRLVDGGESVEQELRVEAGGDVLTGYRRLDRLRGLGLVAGSGVECQDAVTERQLDGGVALGDERDALDQIGRASCRERVCKYV